MAYRRRSYRRRPIGRVRRRRSYRGSSRRSRSPRIRIGYRM